MQERKRKYGYKLFRVRKDGSIGSLFINASRRLPVGEWLEAEGFPTKGFAFRPYWHVTGRPHAPHLGMKGRQWFKVEMGEYEAFKRPAAQGGQWFLASSIKILRPVAEAIVE